MKAAYTISGLFELNPLLNTSINNALGLDEATARQASPLFWPAPSHGSLDAAVGGEESAEYFRQSRALVDIWSGGIETRFTEVPGANHFTAIAPLADPRSAMTLRLADLATHRLLGWIAVAFEGPDVDDLTAGLFDGGKGDERTTGF